MREKIGNYVDEISRIYQQKGSDIEIKYAYFPLPKTEEGEKSIGSDNGGEWETRFYSHGTKEYYNSLLSLKKSGYENIPLADFNDSLLEWTNED